MKGVHFLVVSGCACGDPRSYGGGPGRGDGHGQSGQVIGRQLQLSPRGVAPGGGGRPSGTWLMIFTCLKLFDYVLPTELLFQSSASDGNVKLLLQK